MNVKCAHCEDRHTSLSDVRDCWKGMTRTVKSYDDALELAESSGPYELRDVLAAITLARDEDDDDLLERSLAIAQSIASGTPPSPRWESVLRPAAQRLGHDADLVPLADVAANAAKAIGSRSRDRAYEPPGSRKPNRPKLDELAIFLAAHDGPSLVRACAVLRDIGRPDLGRVVATRAIQVDPDNSPARNTRAAAALDQGDCESARKDLEWAESQDPSSYSANVMSRLCLMSGDPDMARTWALKANKRDPFGSAGNGSLGRLDDNPDIPPF